MRTWPSSSAEVPPRANTSSVSGGCCVRSPEARCSTRSSAAEPPKAARRALAARAPPDAVDPGSHAANENLIPETQKGNMAFRLADVRFTIRRAEGASQVLYPRLLRDRSVLPKIDITVQ